MKSSNKEISINNWIKFFPFKKPREQQEKAINFALNSFIKKNKRIVLMELGTGVGKSAIAITVAKYLNFIEQGKGSYFLTSQKILQDQYIKDFGEPNGNLVSVKSKSNYRCNFYEKFNCQEGHALIKNEKDWQDPFVKNCSSNNCSYTRERNNFLHKEESLTNFLYFLTAKKMFQKRNLLVIDECHFVEDILSKFVEVSVTENYCKNFLNIKFPKFPINDNNAYNWISGELIFNIKKKKEELKNMIDKMNQITKDKNLAHISKTVQNFDKIIKLEDKIKNFITTYKQENWIMNLHESFGQKSKKIEFKPLNISQFTYDNLLKYGHKVLMMSATILDKDIFLSNLGIPKEQTNFISEESPFNTKNKPIFYISSGKMSKNEIDKNLPILIENVKEIINIHKNEKGVIHTTSYKISNFIKNNLKNKRLLFHNENDRDKILNQHINSKIPTILVSPSMNEGVDLKDNLSRFQIICKIPYPFLGDKAIKKKAQQNWKWYNFCAAKSIIQATGRSIRNENDYAVSYILDGCWDNFFKRNHKFFTKSFKESLQQ